MYFVNQVWSAVFDHFACYPVISWTFVVLLQNFINITQTAAKLLVFVQKSKIAVAAILDLIFFV